MASRLPVNDEHGDLMLIDLLSQGVRKWIDYLLCVLDKLQHNQFEANRTSYDRAIFFFFF